MKAGSARVTLAGTRPEGTRTDEQAARQVQEMFSKIAPRYDFLNHLLSLNFDRAWRRRAAVCFGHILDRPEAQVLDLCCGTGDLILALESRARSSRNATPAGQARAVPGRAAGSGLEQGSSSADTVAGLLLGCDFAQPMLERARAKARAAQASALFAAANALELPFAEAQFDLVTAAFGFRNLANYTQGLREMARVLRPGGEVGILEFSAPRGALAGIYRLYFQHLLPRIGGLISGSGRAYAYLPSSVEKFPGPEELAMWMHEAGFRKVTFEPWTMGIVTLHRGQRM